MWTKRSKLLSAVAVAIAVAGCASDSDVGAAPPTSVTRATAANEELYKTFTRSAYGIGTNPEKMLEYGYELCDRYARYEGPRADVIRNWTLENNELLARASLLGANATDYLCPE